MYRIKSFFSGPDLDPHTNTFPHVFVYGQAEVLELVKNPLPSLHNFAQDSKDAELSGFFVSFSEKHDSFFMTGSVSRALKEIRIGYRGYMQLVTPYEVLTSESHNPHVATSFSHEFAPVPPLIILSNYDITDWCSAVLTLASRESTQPMFFEHFADKIQTFLPLVNVAMLIPFSSGTNLEGVVEAELPD